MYLKDVWSNTHLEAKNYKFKLNNALYARHSTKSPILTSCHTKKYSDNI